ncbi:hypothetical protein V492_03176 [Pseudogymnoascus sp. VKM F-4246]|nr:hypothetical protein V492_03176 [Pseudogymnoascus sp. VKM F-4246]
MADPTTREGPEPIKHRLGHYFKTTKKGRVIENWVLIKDSEGKITRKIDLVDPKTMSRKRKRVRKFDKMPALVRIASGGARIGGGKGKGEGEGDGVEEGAEGVAEDKVKTKMKCVVM